MRKRTGGGEALLVNRVATYLKTHYQDQPFRFDQIDQVTTQSGRRNKELHGKWSRGYPDLFIPHCKRNKKGKIKYGGLFIELKATKTVHNTEHTRIQALYHAVLRKQGYMVEFCCGFEEAKAVIDNYLSK